MAKIKYTSKSFNDRYYDEERCGRNFKEQKKYIKMESRRRREQRFAKGWQEPINK